MTHSDGFFTPADGQIVDRREFLPAVATCRRVLHIGCVDDTLTLARHDTGDLLHQELAKVAAELVGLDISEAGIRLLEELVPGRYIVANAESLGEVDLPVSDLVVAAEMIEHLGSPHLFLAGLRDYLAATDATAIITTPNAYSWRNFVSLAFAHRELIHPDHRLIYSERSLARAMEEAGLSVICVRYHTWKRHRRLSARISGFVDRLVLRWEPRLAVGLVFECRARPPAVGG
jgi:predicted TPR repeat methyltransferase